MLIRVLEFVNQTCKNSSCCDVDSEWFKQVRMAGQVSGS